MQNFKEQQRTKITITATKIESLSLGQLYKPWSLHSSNLFSKDFSLGLIATSSRVPRLV